MRTLCAVLLLFGFVILFAFWTSYQIQSFCDRLLYHCHTNARSRLLSTWNDKKIWFSLAVDRELLKELEIALHVWKSCKTDSPRFDDAKQRCEQILKNIKSAYGICFACAL